MEYYVKLTKEELSNLAVFLERINLTGKEVPAYIKIIQAIQEAEVYESKEVEE